MRRIYRLLAIVIALNCVLAIKAYATNTTDQHETAHENLIGAIDRFVLSEEPYRSWYKEGYSNYTPAKDSLEALESTTVGVQVKVFMGTWCHDSQREVPRLIKILESSNFDLSNLEIIALNTAKKTPNGLEKGLNVQRTPTFIFYKDGVEIGRIVEIPRDSLEEDILKIVSGQVYKHSYQE